jgi:predicted nucleotidyltransferase
MAIATSASTFETLRQQSHGRWLADLTSRLEALVASAPGAKDGQLEILLFGSRARGDWDGFSDTDLLVVALGQQSWQELATSPSPHWLAVKAQAISLLRLQP